MNIKCELCKRGIGVNEFCKRLSVSKQTYYNWTTGKRWPNAKYLVQIAEILECTVDELLREYE